MFKKLESGVIINVKLIEAIEKDYEGQQRAKINKGSHIVTERDIEEVMFIDNIYHTAKPMFEKGEGNEKKD